MFKFLAFTLIGIVIGVPLSQQAGAQSAASTVKLTPTLQELTLEPGQSRTIEFEIQNIADSSQTITTTFYDFTPEVTGEPKLLTDSTDDVYGISSWFTPISNLSINSFSKKTIAVEVTVPLNASSATHHGAVAFRTGSEENLSASVASLVFINIGEASVDQSDISTEIINVDSTGKSDLPENLSLPVVSTAEYRFTPVVTIDIVDENGQVIETIASNKSGSVLPMSTRVFTFSLTQELDPLIDHSARFNIALPNGQEVKSMSDVKIYEAPEPVSDDPASGTVQDQTPAEEDSSRTLIPGAIGGVIGYIVFTVVVILRRRIKAKRAQESVATAGNIVPPAPQETPLTQAQQLPSSDPNDPTNNQQL